MKERIVTEYISNDGKIFKDKLKCENYEKKNYIITLENYLKDKNKKSKKDNIYYQNFNILKNRFILGGSRFYGYSTAESDVDYYVQYNEEIKDILICKGFKTWIIDESKHDSNFHSIYEIMLSDIKYQVIAVKNIDAFIYCRDKIMPYASNRNLRKSKNLWNLHYEIYKLIKSENFEELDIQESQYEE